MSGRAVSTVRPRPLAAGAGATAHELAEDALRDLLHPSRAAAHVARDGRRPGRGTVATARLARLRRPHRNADGDAGEGVGKRDLGTRRDVRPARRPSRARGLTEERLAEERAEDVREVPEVEVGRGEAAAAEPFAPEAVVGRAPFRVGEHLVRLRSLAEALLRVGRRRDVRMELACELAEGALDLAVLGSAVDPEDLVVVALSRRHQKSRVPGSTSRAARRPYSSS